MTPLVIDDKAIATLKQFAKENPIGIDENTKIIKGEASPPGERKGYTINLLPCWKLVFSHSQYPRTDKSGTVWVRHMSMSLSKPGRMPNPAVIQLLSEQLGFPSLDKCQVRLEDEIVEVISELNGAS